MWKSCLASLSEEWDTSVWNLDAIKISGVGFDMSFFLPIGVSFLLVTTAIFIAM